MKIRYSLTILATIILAALLTLITGPITIAQQTAPWSPVQHTATHADAGLNVSSTATTATTLTLATNGMFVYIWEVDIQNCEGTAVTAAAPTSLTTTNLGSANALTFLIGSGPATAGTCAQSFSAVYPTGLKSFAQGTNVTFVTPTFITNQTVRVNIAWSNAL